MSVSSCFEYTDVIKEIGRLYDIFWKLLPGQEYCALIDC